MVQNQIVQAATPTVCYRNKMKPMKSVKVCDFPIISLFFFLAFRSTKQYNLILRVTR